MSEHHVITIERFEATLPFICDKETSQDPDHWTRENYLCGHCAVVSAVALRLFGGKLLRASLAAYPRFAHMRSHYLNGLPDGTIRDLTAPQFGDDYPDELNLEEREISYVLSYPETTKRYKLLFFRLIRELGGRNKLFDDEIYRRCIYAAMDSPCPKMNFGCVITRDGNVVYEGCNQTIPELKHLCEPACVRLSIQSRTESMLGACGHAEEMGLWHLYHEGIPASECVLYIAGIFGNGAPSIEQVAEHSCLRCSVQMNFAKIQQIFVPVIDHWESIDTKEALKTAALYATQQKKV